MQGKGSVTADDPAGDRRRAGRREPPGADRGRHRDRDARSSPSKDGRSVVVNFKLAGTDEQVEKLVEQPLAAVAAVQSRPPRRARRAVRRRLGRQGDRRPGREGRQEGARRISYGLLLIILLVAFGALVAAGLPLVLGATAVAATVGLLGPVSQLYALPPDVAELVVIIGLAVGVDYAMFYSRRMMEERDRGHSAEAAVEIAAATSGRAVLISGLTVMTAMAGLLFAGNPIFVGFGIGTMLVVAVARARVDDLPARDALVPRPEELAGEGPRALHHQAPPPGQGRVARLGRHPHPRPQAPARVDGDRRRPARRPLRPRARHPVQGPGLRRLLAQPAGHPDLRSRSRPPSPAAPFRPRP